MCPGSLPGSKAANTLCRWRNRTPLAIAPRRAWRGFLLAVGSTSARGADAITRCSIPAAQYRGTGGPPRALPRNAQKRELFPTIALTGASSALQKKLHEESKAHAPEQANDGRSRHYEHSTRGSVIRRYVPFLVRE